MARAGAHAKSQRRDRSGKFAPEGKPPPSASNDSTPGTTLRRFDEQRDVFRAELAEASDMDDYNEATERIAGAHKKLAAVHRAFVDSYKQTYGGARDAESEMYPLRHEATVVLATLTIKAHDGQDIQVTDARGPDNSSDSQTSHIDFRLENPDGTSKSFRFVVEDDIPEEMYDEMPMPWSPLYAQQPTDSYGSLLNHQGLWVLEDRLQMMKNEAVDAPDQASGETP